jgi:hypothetical protein
MSNPTSNFGWQMPTATDLVTDLPADFEVFGQAVDTAMMDLKGGTTGQVLKKNTNTDMDFVWGTVAGDIEGVSVTSPITGGGTSGTVTIGIDSTAVVPSQTGNSGKYLTTNGTASSWATVSGWAPNYQLLNAGGTTMSGSNTITISGISGINSLLIRVGGDNLVRNATANATFNLRLNTDTGNNYYYAGLIVDGGNTASTYGVTVDSSFKVGNFGASANSSYMMASIQIDGTGTAGIKPITLTSYAAGGTQTSSQSVSLLGSYNGTSAITSVSLISNGTFSGTGQVFVYGA